MKYILMCLRREEKQLEASVEALIQRVQDLKSSITSFLFKLETEYTTLNWPTVLDNFALISSNVSSLNRLMKNDKCPIFRNYALLPLVLAPDRDTEIEKLTEGRVFAFNHEVVPDYLRTKAEPEVEERVTMLQNKLSTLTADGLQKQMNQLAKVTNNMIEAINNAKEEWETDTDQKAQQPPTSSITDTHILVAGTTYGKGLKIKRSDVPDRPVSGQPVQIGPPVDQRPPPGPTPNVHINKAPSTIKTNIRPGGVQVHPYQRP